MWDSQTDAPPCVIIEDIKVLPLSLCLSDSLTQTLEPSFAKKKKKKPIPFPVLETGFGAFSWFFFWGGETNINWDF